MYPSRLLMDPQRATYQPTSFFFFWFVRNRILRLEKNLLNSPNDIKMREHLRKDSVDIKTTIPDMFQIIFHKYKKKYFKMN